MTDNWIFCAKPLRKVTSAVKIPVLAMGLLLAKTFWKKSKGKVMQIFSIVQRGRAAGIPHLAVFFAPRRIAFLNRLCGNISLS